MNHNAIVTNHERYLLGIPVAATLLIWMWVGSMNLLQSPGNTLFMIGLLAVGATATLAALEVGSHPQAADGPAGRSPTAWFFLIGLLWFVGYPMYMYQRRHRGLPNRLVPAAIVAVVFLFSYFAMNAGIESRKADVRERIEDMRSRFSSPQ